MERIAGTAVESLRQLGRVTWPRGRRNRGLEATVTVPVYTATFLAAAMLALFVWRHYDPHEREPWPAIVAAIFVGAIGMWFIGIADEWALRTLGLTIEHRYSRALVIAIVEEVGKLATILVLAWFVLRRCFNDPLDGLIYGRMVGLGMAVEESMLYLSLNPATLDTLGMEVVRLFGHSLMGGLVGFAIGIGARPDGPRQRHVGLAAGCLLLSTALHFAWDAVAYGPQDSVTARILPMGLMLVMMLIWRGLWSIAETRSREYFSPQAAPAIAA